MFSTADSYISNKEGVCMHTSFFMKPRLSQAEALFIT